MEDSDKVSDYFTKILSITNQMKRCGESINDFMIVERIMRSLPQRLDYIVVAIEESKDTEKMKIEELQSSLEVHEMRLVDRNPIKNDEQALKALHVRSEEKKKFKKWKGKPARGKWKNEYSVNEQDGKVECSEGKSGSEKNIKKKDIRNVECFSCHKMEHYSFECYSNKGKHKKKQQNKEAYLAQEDSDSEPLTLMVTTTTDNSHSFMKSWYLDSGCSNHMTCNKEWLVRLDESKKSRVRFADNNTLQVEGMGNVVIRRKDGSHAIIEDVLLVLAMKCNLLSLGQLVEKGFTVVMGGCDQVEVFDKNKVLILRSKISKNRTFQVCMDAVGSWHCLSTVKDDET
ncbi:uncharacterized protein LOC124841336 [Vigna umbellata]|uniref:uncharacterized protein LOC124841336 n=1 Tax=Vigna umbellata TaxID=87088 RepID=UPI001F5F3576|nr:uncharacterized protein LOC124841336 [Vigna umbellata]